MQADPQSSPVIFEYELQRNERPLRDRDYSLQSDQPLMKNVVIGVTPARNVPGQGKSGDQDLEQESKPKG
jgi:hypothetical protein